MRSFGSAVYILAVRSTKVDVNNMIVFYTLPNLEWFFHCQEFKKKARAAKIDSLYFRQDDGSYEVLADDR